VPKTLIFPIVAVVAMLAKVVFGVEISEDEQAVIVENIATVVIAGTALYSIVKNIVKKVKENKEKPE
jgi:uncharacterized protein (DUF697 family)